MRYEKLNNLSNEEFRRLTGVKKSSFEKMVSILFDADFEKRKRGGKRHALEMEDRLLMTLEYLREYRTYFHVSSGYGISESSCFRNIKWIENTLVKHPDFALPGRKALLKSDMAYAVVLIDATESPIERPKKDKNTSILERRKNTH